MNQFTNLDAQDEMSRLAQVQGNELPENPQFVPIDDVDNYLEQMGY